MNQKLLDYLRMLRKCLYLEQDNKERYPLIVVIASHIQKTLMDFEIYQVPFSTYHNAQNQINVQVIPFLAKGGERQENIIPCLISYLLII